MRAPDEEALALRFLRRNRVDAFGLSNRSALLTPSPPPSPPPRPPSRSSSRAHRRRPFLIRKFENTLIKLLLSMDFYDEAGKRKLGIGER